MALLINDPSMWSRTEALKDVQKSRSRPAASSAAVTVLSKRRNESSVEPTCCAHCGRNVSRLIFVNACTFECALAMALPVRYRYDYVFSAIMRQLDRIDVPMPRPAPPTFGEDDVEEYWRRATAELYSHQPAMAHFLRERLQQNAVVTGSSAGAPKKQRSD